MTEYGDLIYRQRPVSTRHGRMKRADRAKQFAPFAALKGYEEAIHRQERQVSPRKLLSESRKEELDWLLRQIQPGDTVRGGYYAADGYETVTGTVARIDSTFHCLLIDGKKIAFDSISELEGAHLVPMTEDGI